MERKSVTGCDRRTFVTGAMALAVPALAMTPIAKADAQQGAEGRFFGKGQAAGRNGDIVVEVNGTAGHIDEVVVIKSVETMSVGEAAIDILKQKVVEQQSLALDAVSSATITSMAFLAAVEAALEDAGVDPAIWSEAIAAPVVRENAIPAEADVVVIGAGSAGMIAAMTAQAAGKSVVVLEKMEIVGGSSALSGFGYAAPGNWIQVGQGIEDSPELMMQDMLTGGDNEGDPELVKVICDGALDGLNYMVYGIGIQMRPNFNVQDGGHSIARSVIPNYRGAGVVKSCSERLGAMKVPVLTSAKVEHITRGDDGAVCGVVGTDLIGGGEFTVACKSVVIATGGFGASYEMRKKYNPDFADGYGCTDAVGITGDGIVMAEEIGAQLADMEFIQVHPTGDPQTGAMLGLGSIRTAGVAIEVNKEGHRFVNELARRDVASQATLAQTDGLGYYIYSKQDYNDASQAIEIAGMTARGLYVCADTLEEALGQLGIDATAAAEEIAKWNADVEAGGVDQEFGYSGVMKKISDGPYAVFATTPVIHYTMGGVLIDTDARVLDTDGNPIPGLYACGEVTGNIMGTNRLGTTAAADCVVFGRIAGANAALL